MADNSLIWNAKSVDEIYRLAMIVLKVRKFSEARGLSTSAYEDVWISPPASRTRLSAAATMTIVSSSANDTAAGTRALKAP